MKTDLTNQFGTEESLGIQVIWTHPDRHTAMLAPTQVPDWHKDALDSESVFPDGLDAVCCTWYAVQVYKAYPGRVQILGFANQDNPTSLVAREQLHPGGHDFAVLDNRYIIDPWLKLVACVTEEVVLDLTVENDVNCALNRYGPRNLWQRNLNAERFAQKLSGKS